MKLKIMIMHIRIIYTITHYAQSNIDLKINDHEFSVLSTTS